MNYSYWELKEYFRQWDLVVIGGGIVGLSTAISFKEKEPKANVLILERGILPNGASTKNAGFACFGSPGELLDDLSVMPAETVWETVHLRWEGLKLLKKRLGEKAMNFQKFGGYELFYDRKAYDEICAQLPELNKSMRYHTGIFRCFVPTTRYRNTLGGIAGIVFNKEEGQIDTGLMMRALAQKARILGIILLNNIEVRAISDSVQKAILTTSAGDFESRQVVVATNGFARELLHLEEVRPARAQVLITSPVKNLKLKGTFHFHHGFYYFRNIDNRILFGGGRNLDAETESTSNHGINSMIHSTLDKILATTILPGQSYSVDHRWTGIMGVGPEKKPIIRRVSPCVTAAVRMGGMGIAIGSWVGRQAAELVRNDVAP